MTSAIPRQALCPIRMVPSLRSLKFSDEYMNEFAISPTRVAFGKNSTWRDRYISDTERQLYSHTAQSAWHCAFCGVTPDGCRYRRLQCASSQSISVARDASPRPIRRRIWVFGTKLGFDTARVVICPTRYACCTNLVTFRFGLSDNIPSGASMVTYRGMGEYAYTVNGTGASILRPLTMFGTCVGLFNVTVSSMLSFSCRSTYVPHTIVRMSKATLGALLLA